MEQTWKADARQKALVHRQRWAGVLILLAILFGYTVYHSLHPSVQTIQMSFTKTGFTLGSPYETCTVSYREVQSVELIDAPDWAAADGVTKADGCVYGVLQMAAQEEWSCYARTASRKDLVVHAGGKVCLLSAETTQDTLSLYSGLKKSCPNAVFRDQTG